MDDELHQLNTRAMELFALAWDEEKAERQATQARIAALEDVLLDFLASTPMKMDKYTRGLWMCPLCRAEYMGLADLEAGKEHRQNCPYAIARQLLGYAQGDEHDG